eukprot:COSAG02_NODE_6811_length_3348_cov_123.512158_3_plen_163_part_00
MPYITAGVSWLRCLRCCNLISRSRSLYTSLSRAHSAHVRLCTTSSCLLCSSTLACTLSISSTSSSILRSITWSSPLLVPALHPQQCTGTHCVYSMYAMYREKYIGFVPNTQNHAKWTFSIEEMVVIRLVRIDCSSAAGAAQRNQVDSHQYKINLWYALNKTV